jgi:EmrB/QacA subfamily drug resistance transporter
MSEHTGKLRAPLPSDAADPEVDTEPGARAAVLTDLSRESGSAPAGSAPPSSEPAIAGGHRNLGIALAVISAAQLMVVLDASIVNIALPFVQRDLGFSQSSLSWVVNAYTLAFGGLLLLGGRAGDLLGRRRVFIFGVLVFALASLLGGLAQNETWLISARVLQGFGAAVASPTALSLITTTFPAGPPRNRAFAVYAAMSGAGLAVGLLLGGALTEISWRWTFFINVPIGIAVAVLAPIFLGESQRSRGRFDLPGAVTATAGLVSLVYGLTHAATTSWGDRTTVVTIALGIVLIVTFLVIEARSSHALMPFRVLANRNRAAAYVAMLAIGSSIFAMFYFLSLYIQTVLGYSSLRTGVAFLPVSVGIVAAAQLASALVSRVDPRWIAGTGALLAGAGMLWMSRLGVHSTYLGGLLGPILVLSIGMGLAFVPLTLTAVAGVEKADSGVASAVLNTMQQVGGALGLATLSTVSASAAKGRATELVTQLRAQAGSGRLGHGQLAALQAAIRPDSFSHGASVAYLVAAVIMVGSAVVIYAGLHIRHRDLAADNAGAAIAH